MTQATKPAARADIHRVLDGAGWMSVGQIARATGFSHTTVRRCLTELGAERQWLSTALHPHAIYRLVG